MVGNDVQEDQVAARVGMRTYLVTDYLKNPDQGEFQPDWFGSLADLADWMSAGPDL
ncbi:MAG: hypothetical protein ACOY40_13100 [Bacillota bacterium]